LRGNTILNKQAGMQKNRRQTSLMSYHWKHTRHTVSTMSWYRIRQTFWTKISWTIWRNKNRVHENWDNLTLQTANTRQVDIEMQKEDQIEHHLIDIKLEQFDPYKLVSSKNNHHDKIDWEKESVFLLSTSSKLWILLNDFCHHKTLLYNIT